MTIDTNLTTFAGRPVADWRPGEDLPDLATTAVRVRAEEWWDKDGGAARLLLPLLHALAEAGGDRVEALVVGCWGESYDNTSTPIVAWLEANAHRLPALRSLFLGDVTFEECEISWIEQSDITPLFGAYPDLEVLGVRGATKLGLEPVTHGALRQLTIETGGLPSAITRAVAASTLPALTDLELWLGTEDYGRSTGPADLAPILEGRFALHRLALRDAEGADEIAAAVAEAPVLDGLGELDLSLGDLTDVGAEALLASSKVPGLTKLDLHFNYLTAATLARLGALPIHVDASDVREPEHYGDETYRPIAVAE